MSSPLVSWRQVGNPYKELVDHADTGMIIHRQYEPVYLNTRWATLHGTDIKAVFAAGDIRNIIGVDSTTEQGHVFDSPCVAYRLRSRDGIVKDITTIAQSISWEGAPAVLMTVVAGERNPIDADPIDDAERFKDFANASCDWFWEMDRDLRFTFISNNVSEYLGVDDSEIVGKSRSALVRADSIDTQAWTEHLETLARREPFRDFVYCSQGHGDRERWVRVSGTPIFDNRKQFVGYRGTGVDITDQKSAELRRIESDKRFRDFSEIAADWFWELDAKLKFTYVSERFSDICGVSVATLLDASFSDMTHYMDVDTSVDEVKTVQSNQDNAHAVPSLWEKMNRRETFDDLQFCWHHPQGHTVRISANGRPMWNAHGTFIGYRGTASDITESYLLSKELLHRAQHDDLTGLFNRVEFERRLTKALDDAHANNHCSILLYIDLDQFKVVNDSVGHLAGDELLKNVAGIIASQLRDNDIVARLGGDEFGVLLTQCPKDKAERIAGRIAELLSDYRFTWGEHIFKVTSSIGLVSVDASSVDISELLSKADIACYAAKDAGRNRIHAYEVEDADVKERHTHILQAAGIREALESQRFRLYKQPIVSIAMDNNHTNRFEVLLRLMGDDNNIIAPGVVIPAAERFNLMQNIDHWVLDKSISSYQELVEHHGDIQLSINLSGNTLNDRNLPQYIGSLFDKYPVDPSKICFEVTETAFISSLNQARDVIESIKQFGSSFALDDFGSGLSSFAYLKHLPVDFLKIDGSFVKDIATDETDYAVVSAINQVGHMLNMKTIAEFVEDKATFDLLREIGVDYAQGFGLGKPVPLGEPFQMEDLGSQSLNS